MSYSPNNVKVAAGTLYAAPLGTAEPVAVTGAWTGWYPLGYTHQGSEFDFGPTVQPITVEEEYYPIRQAITEYTGKITFVLTELTQQNLSLALNNGIGSSTGTESQPSGANPGSFFQEPVNPGSEVRVMLGWDAAFEGQPAAADPFQRFIWRQCLQVGSVKRMFRKGNNIASYSVEFALEKPFGSTVNVPIQPWRSIQPASLVS